LVQTLLKDVNHAELLLQYFTVSVREMLTAAVCTRTDPLKIQCYIKAKYKGSELINHIFCSLLDLTNTNTNNFYEFHTFS